MFNRLIVFCFLLLPLFSCADDNSPRCVDLELEENFTIRITETTTLCSEAVQITFADVINESRCPSDVTCVWAGFVQVELIIIQEGLESIVELSSDETATGVPTSINLESMKLTLVDVTPHPSTSVKIDGSKREVILKLEKITG